MREPAERPEAPVRRQGPRAAETAAGRTTYLGEVAFQPDLPTAGLKAQLIYEKLAKLGEVCDCQPPAERLDEIEQLDCFRFRVTTDQSAEAVAGQLRIGGVLRVSLEALTAQPAGTVPKAAAARGSAVPARAQTQRPLPEAGPRATASGQRPTETVRVDTDRLDQLMDLAGQLVINQAQFSQIGDRLKAVVDCNQAVQALDKLCGALDRLGSGGTLRVDGQHPTAELEAVRGQVRRIRNDMDPLRREVQTLSRARDSVRELLEAIHQLDRVSDGIQKGVMDIRMVPIGPLFARFNRVVRDISRAGGKQVRLAIAGEKTELDKRMIDELGDPLVHLVRNSADHGIEPPDEREAAGKPRQGTVTLDAFHRGNSIVIEVRDDGKGLDADRILRKALDKGLVTEADAQRMTAAPDLPVDLEAGAEHRREGDRGLRPRHGNGHRQDEDRGAQRHRGYRQRAGPGNHDHHQAPLDAGHPAFADGRHRRRRVRHAHGSRDRNRQRRPEPGSHGARAADGDGPRAGGRAGAAGRPAELPPCRRRVRQPRNARKPPWWSSATRARKSAWPSTASSAKRTWSSSRSPRITGMFRESRGPASSATAAWR